MAAEIAPLPSPPANARWRPVDLVEPGDTVLDPVTPGGRGRVLDKGRLDGFLAAAGRPERGTDDVGLLVDYGQGAEPYGHAVHIVDMAQAESFAEGSPLPAIAFCGVVRLALVPA